MLHKIAIYGGSFNPVHIGHVFVVEYLKVFYDFEGIIIVPCGNHPFNKELISFNHRFEMCQRAFLNDRQPAKTIDGIGITQNNIIISDAENTEEISYSIDTAKFFQESLKPYVFVEHELKLTWVIGSDCLENLDKWKDIDELKKIVDFLVIPREVANGTLPTVSSTEIRKKIKNNESIDGLVPLRVKNYMEFRKLYLAEKNPILNNTDSLKG